MIKLNKKVASHTLIHVSTLALILALLPQSSMAIYSRDQVEAILSIKDGISAFANHNTAYEYLGYLIKGKINEKGERTADADDLVFATLKDSGDSKSKAGYYKALVGAMNEQLYSLDDASSANERNLKQSSEMVRKISEYVTQDPEAVDHLLSLGLAHHKSRTGNVFLAATYRAIIKANSKKAIDKKLLSKLGTLAEKYTKLQDEAAASAKASDKLYSYTNTEGYKLVLGMYDDLATACSGGLDADAFGPECEKSQSSTNPLSGLFGSIAGKVSGMHQSYKEGQKTKAEAKAKAKAEADAKAAEAAAKAAEVAAAKAKAEAKAQREKEEAELKAKEDAQGAEDKAKWKAQEEANAAARAAEQERLKIPREEEMLTRAARNRIVQVLNGPGLPGGLPHNASYAQIKSAIRRAAILLHPDKNNGDDSRMKTLNSAIEAYRKLYGEHSLTWPEGDN